MIKPKTIAKRIEECWHAIRQVKGRQRFVLLSRFNTLLMMHGKQSKDLFDESVRHTTMPDGSVVTHSAQGIYSAGGVTP